MMKGKTLICVNLALSLFFAVSLPPKVTYAIEESNTDNSSIANLSAAVSDAPAQFDPKTMAVVSSSQALQSALANSSIFYIFLANNITIGHNMPIINNATRTGGDTLTIYGYNPFSGDTPEVTRYVLTETSSGQTTLGNRIYLNTSAGSLNTIVLRDIEVYGTDYYGTVFISESSSYENYLLKYVNFKYTGPQPTYHTYGSAYYENSDIHLKQTLSNPAQEVAEIKNVTFSGQVNITRDSVSTDSILWLRRADGGITIRADAEVTVLNNTSATVGYGFVYNTANSNIFSIEKDAKFYYEDYNCFTRNYRFSEMTIGDSSEVEIRIKGNITNGANSSALSTADLIVNEDAVFYVYAPGSTSTNYVLNVYSATYNNPWHIILYNGRSSGGYAMSFGDNTPGNYRLNDVKSVRYWTTAPGLPIDSDTMTPTISIHNTMDGNTFDSFSVTATGNGSSISAASSPQLPNLTTAVFNHNTRGVIEIRGTETNTTPTIDTQISVEVPVQLLWAALESGEGNIVSPVYSITNKSDMPVKVSLSELITSDAMDGITIVPGVPVFDGEVQLHIKHLNGSGFVNSINGIAPDKLLTDSNDLGVLGGSVNNPNNAAQYGKFTIGGTYEGSFYEVPRQPKIWFVFQFELSDQN